MPNAATDETTANGLSSNASCSDPPVVVASDSVNSGELCMASDPPNGTTPSSVIPKYWQGMLQIYDAVGPQKQSPQHQMQSMLLPKWRMEAT